MYGTAAVGVGLLFNAANWRYWVLPVCSMSLANLAFYAMWLRRYMVDESNKDYVRLARAKGVCGRDIALHHVFRNAMVPLVQYIPSAFLNTVVGSIYIESLYSIPGMGGLLVTCVQRHDNTMVQGIVLLYACVGIVGLILGDILMVLIDPRINFGKRKVAADVQTRVFPSAGGAAEHPAKGRPRRVGRPAGGGTVHPRRVQQPAGGSHCQHQLQLLGQHFPCLF